MTVSSFEEARAAVNEGREAAEVARELVGSMSPEDRLWCLDGDAPTWAGLAFLAGGGYHRAPFLAAKVDHLGLPGIAFSDGPRGAVVGNATCFPVTMARGATWDASLEERVGCAIGRELRAIGATLAGSVCVNLLRHPAWGRAQETYGEDPLHVGELGAALTRGLQRHVMACVKHFACNSMENARFSVDIEVDEVALHEVYLPHFRRIVDAGVACVMSAYNSLNGEWCGENRDMLTRVLRDEWGFEGFVISDWIFGLRDAARSLSAGLDIEMPYRMVRAQHLSAALEHGTVTWEDVDSAVERVIATLLRFDDVLTHRPAQDVVGCAEHRELAREVAARAIVVLRNELVEGQPLLPLTPDTRLAVIGRLADTVNLGDGGSSDVWDLDCRTVLDGLSDAFAVALHDDGSDPWKAASVASVADAAVVVVGYTFLDEGEYIGATDPSLGQLFPPGDESEVVERFEAMCNSIPSTEVPERVASRPAGFSVGGDRDTLRLHSQDVDLIRTVASANPRTIVVVQAGSAVIMTEWIASVPAVVLAWYGGSRAGDGLADILLGAVNPSARLPFTIPAEESDLPPFDRDAAEFRYDRWHGWWRFARNGRAPAFPFGFGLSYTDFTLVDAGISAEGNAVVARGRLANVGVRDGADVVQVYAELPYPDTPARLVGFNRLEVRAGEEVPFEVRVPVERLATRDANGGAWRAASGHHRFIIARFASDPDACSAEVDL